MIFSPKYINWLGARVFILFCCSLFVLASGCSPKRAEQIIILDAITRTNLTFVSDVSQGRFSSVKVMIDGWVDGRSSIVLQQQQPINVSGYIKWHYSIDWFEKNFSVAYFPSNVTKGVLVIRCRFF